MRHRGDIGKQASPQPSTAAAAAARAASKRSSTQKLRLRGFWIGTGCFLVCVLIYICFRSPSFASSGVAQKTAKTELRVTERDVVALGLVTRQVNDLATLPGFEELSKTAAQIGVVYFTLLEQVSAAEELEDGGHTLRQLDVSQHHLTSVADALRAAADVSYAKLKGMLLREPGAELAMAPTSLVRTMYGWMLSDLFLYSVVLPEYCLLRDDTPTHATVLLRSVNLLSWSSLVHTVPSSDVAVDNAHSSNGAVLMRYNIFNWSGGAACRKGPLGSLSKKWMQFCETSFSSPSAAARRAAATYEELIVLYPNYAPLRLHYAIVFTFLGFGYHVTGKDAPAATVAKDGSFLLSDHVMKALRVVRNDRKKVGHQYKHPDAVHIPMLTLLEAFLTPVDKWAPEQQVQLVHALSELGNCDHARDSLLASLPWSGDSVFQKEYRVPLLTAEQWSLLLAKAQALLGAGHMALASFRECL